MIGGFFCLGGDGWRVRCVYSIGLLEGIGWDGMGISDLISIWDERKVRKFRKVKRAIWDNGFIGIKKKYLLSVT